jgi:glycerol uptake facilitator-like aquaporin
MKTYLAELPGTFTLVFAGTGPIVGAFLGVLGYRSLQEQAG